MILVAGFVSWDPNLILSAAFTPEHLGMDFFWRRFRTCWMRAYFCFNKMINGKIAPSKSRHHQVFARSPTQNPKATHLRPSAQHTLTVLGHGRPCAQKHFTWGHPENCGIAVKHLTYIYRYLSRSKKRRFHSTACIKCHLILLCCCSTLFLPFQQTIAYVVITPWPWCPTCNFNMSQLQSLKKSHHFFQLQRLVRSKSISLIFKPWQPCCFGTEMQYIHSPSMTTFATTLSFKSEKLNPKLCHS